MWEIDTDNIHIYVFPVSPVICWQTMQLRYRKETAELHTKRNNKTKKREYKTTL